MAFRAKVFISCGQATDAERATALAIRDWFAAEGYDPYLAIEVQSILDLNQGIVAGLKRSDYYLFVKFRREHVGWIGSKRRGSLFTNQELAIACALDFENMIDYPGRRAPRGRLEGRLELAGKAALSLRRRGRVATYRHTRFH